MKVIWSLLAIDRANEIVDFISSDKPAAAGKWAARLFEKVERLEQFPYSGRIVPELNRSEIREIIFGNYRVIYRVRKEEISILTIRHSKQRLRRQDIKE